MANLPQSLSPSEPMNGRVVYYDMDGKKLEHVHGDFCFWPNPHPGWDPVHEDGQGMGRWRCIECGHEGDDLGDLQRSNCSKEYEPCGRCGLRGVCASDCSGIMEALSSPKVHLAGSAGERVQ